MLAHRLRLEADLRFDVAALGDGDERVVDPLADLLAYLVRRLTDEEDVDAFAEVDAELRGASTDAHRRLGLPRVHRLDPARG